MYMIGLETPEHHTKAKITAICSKHLGTHSGRLLTSAKGYFIALEAECLMFIWNITTVIIKKKEKRNGTKKHKRCITLFGNLTYC